jgi:hypothetical protein
VRVGPMSAVSPAMPCLQPPVLIVRVNQQTHTLLAQLNHHHLSTAAAETAACCGNIGHVCCICMHAECPIRPASADCSEPSTLMKGGEETPTHRPLVALPMTTKLRMEHNHTY